MFGWSLKFENETFSPICPYGCFFLGQKFTSENGTFLFGRRPNTEPSENGTKVDCPRTEHVWILDVDCICKIVFYVGSFFNDSFLCYSFSIFYYYKLTSYYSECLNTERLKSELC